MDQYPTWVGFVFVFNLIVGTGSLILPSAFAKTGYVLSTILVLFLAFTSYLTVTFVIETLACSNAVLKWRKIQQLKREGSVDGGNRNDDDISTSSTEDEERTLVQPAADDDDDEAIIEGSSPPILSNSFYTLDEKIELGEMSKLFLPSAGSLMFYVFIVVYLYGDMSIYSAAVSTTIRDVMCDKNTTNSTNANASNWLEEPCWINGTINRFDAYRLCLLAFTLTLSPFVFFNVSKTKHLQFFTLSFRFVAFSIMIGIATMRIISPPDPAQVPNPKEIDINNVPFLIGSIVYAYMSQHSLPSLLVPIKEKHKISRIVLIDYFIITSLYLTLALTGIFAFEKVEDLYTLNFIPTDQNQAEFFKIIEYLLALFPVFTLTTSFPIVAITLRNNLQTLFVEKSQLSSQNVFVRRILFPLMAVIPPFIITFNTENVRSLVSFTGSYAGAFIQYFIPIFLVYHARKTCGNILGHGIVNDFRSKFQSNYWLLLLFTWTCVSLIFVSIKLFS